MLQSSKVMFWVERVLQNSSVLSYSPRDTHTLRRLYCGLAMLLALSPARSPHTMEKACPCPSKYSSTWQNGWRLTRGVAMRRLSQWSWGPGRRKPSVRTCEDAPMADAPGARPAGFIWAAYARLGLPWAIDALSRLIRRFTSSSMARWSSSPTFSSS